VLRQQNKQPSYVATVNDRTLGHPASRGLQGERVIGRAIRSLEDTDVRRGIAMRWHDRTDADQGGR
jgi:hypothetical protein